MRVVQKFDTRKIYQLSSKVFFPLFCLFLPSFLLLNLARWQCYADAIGLFTSYIYRLEIKSWLEVKLCAHAQCVLLWCWPLVPYPFPLVTSLSVDPKFFHIRKLVTFWGSLITDSLILFLWGRYLLQLKHKVSFTACHLGKLWLTYEQD